MRTPYPILEVQGIRDWDAYTIENEPISSYLLMERAASMAALFIANNFSTQHPIFIYAGSGNNGGDGVAMARLLAEKKYNVTICIETFSQWSPDTQKNIQKLPDQVVEVEEIDQYDFTPQTIIVDALFGSGLNRPIEGQIADTIEKLNKQKGKRIAIDIPSGLFADTLNDKDCIFKADYTLTFEVPKKVMRFSKSLLFTGKVMVLPIGLQAKFLDNCETESFWYLPHNVSIQKRSLHSHKGAFGKVSVIGGSRQIVGAPILAALAASKTGAGWTAIGVPEKYKVAFATQYPELMQVDTKGKEEVESVSIDDRTNVLVLGPGLGNAQSTKVLVANVLQLSNKHFVVDADGLNALANNEIEIPDNAVLTPHRKEMERLLGQEFTSDQDLNNRTQEFAVENACYIVLKSAHTSVFTPQGKVFAHLGGNDALAKGGSGDVLSGIIAGLLAQGYPEEDACNVAIEIQQHAAHLFCKNNASHAMQSQDLIDRIGASIKDLEK